ncbi:MAG: glycosyltransferase [Planctomycetota bacterium]|nr:glycosyltransferase [Planctomycetota bacterium]
MRIARILTRLNLGGPARQALASDPLLAARGHVVQVFTGAPAVGEGDLFDTFREKGIQVERVPGLARGLSVAGDLRALHALKKRLVEFAPDVVHTHASKAGAIGRRAARAVPKARRVHTFHGHVLEGYFGDTVSRAITAFERRWARETQRIVAVSHATADDLLRLKVVDDATKLVVIQPGIDLADLLAIERRDGALRREIGAADGDFVVGVVGRLAEVKRPEWALDAFELLAVRYPRLHLVFIGDGDQRGLVERRITGFAPELQRRAHLLGMREDMRPVLADVDLVLSTSRAEGMPVALIEAAAAGKPVVATNVGGVAEIVVHERTGWLAKDVDELAYGLAQYLDAPATLFPALAIRARMRVEKNHSGAALADRLESLYKSVVEEPTCAS